MSNEQVKLCVYRTREDLDHGEGPDGPRAQQAHNKRRKALEEELDAPGLRVLDWGDTKDQRSHELVEVVVEFASSPAVQATGLAIMDFAGNVISEACSALITDGVKYLFGKLVSRIRHKEIQEFQIIFPGGAWMIVKSDFNGTINVNGDTISFKTGQ